MAICREQGFVPGAIRAVPEIADLETPVGLVACGLGVTILPSPFEALICSKRVVFKPIEDLRTRDADGRPTGEKTARCSLFKNFVGVASRVGADEQMIAVQA